jgi:hypothetical protein
LGLSLDQLDCALCAAKFGVSPYASIPCFSLLPIPLMTASPVWMPMRTCTGIDDLQRLVIQRELTLERTVGHAPFALE